MVWKFQGEIPIIISFVNLGSMEGIGSMTLGLLTRSRIQRGDRDFLGVQWLRKWEERM